MKWNFTTDRPIYLQIIKQMELALLSGEYKAGQKLPSVREFAAQAGVNPNTMQRALQELEQTGLIITQRTAGRTITEDTTMINGLREKAAQQEIADFLMQMEKLGYHKAEIIDLLQHTQEVSQPCQK